MMRVFRSSLVFCCIFISLSLCAQEASEAPKKVSIPVGPHAFASASSLYLGAVQAGAKDFSVFNLSGDVLTACVPATVTHNYILNQPNPIYDKKINYLTLFKSTPLVVLDDSPGDIKHIAYLGADKNPTHILSTGTVHDAAGLPTSGIVGMTWCQTSTCAQSYFNYVAVAVKPQQGVWGQPGSGIALIKSDQELVEAPADEKKPEDSKDTKKEKKDKKSEEDKKKQEEKKMIAHQYFNILDAQTGKAKDNKAYPLDICLPPYASLVQDPASDTIDLYWEPNFQRLYIPLSIKTDATAGLNQGACALLIGTIDNDQLSLSPLIKADVFASDKDTIIGAVGPNKTVSLSKIRTMYTSTSLPYLIVLGSDTVSGECISKVAAFPLTNNDATGITAKQLLTNAEHGVIAGKREIPTTRFLGGRYGRFRGRIMREPARTQEDFYTYDERAVCVGSGTIATNLRELFVVNDCVFALVDHDFKGQQAGVFYAQALFEGDGRIASWTPWKRVPCCSRDIIDMFVDLTTNTLVFFEPKALKIHSAAWKPEFLAVTGEAKSVADILRKEFPQGTGGAQGLFDFGATSTSSSSLLVATGNKKVVLLQTGTELASISMTGDALNKLGPIDCAEIVRDDTQAWLVVGGFGGIAVFADEQGKGWSLAQGLGKKFSGIAPTYSFKQWGNYRDVKKIIQNENGLYILTRDRLERLSISNALFAANSAKDVTVMATFDQLHAKFTDVLVSGPFALLATTEGLLRVGNDGIGWVPVTMSASSPHIISLFCACPAGRDTGFAYDGQVYVLSGSINTQEASVHRFFVRDVEKYGINDATLSLVVDYSMRGQATSFITFGGYRNKYATDGLVHISTCGGMAPLVHILSAFVGGKQVVDAKASIIPLVCTPNSSVSSLVRNSADGSWLIAGDCGTCTYQ